MTNAFAAVPHVIDDGVSDQACYGCENALGNRVVRVDATGVAGVDNARFPYFRYQVCAKCGTLDLVSDASDGASLYGENYYSFDEHTPGFLERLAIRLRNRFELKGTGVLGRGISYVWPGPRHRALRPLLEGTVGNPLKTSSRILDVGCGYGKWLQELHRDGFSNLTGVDPYLSTGSDIRPIKLIKGNVADLDGPFDLVTIHHAFEHIADGESALRAMRAILSDEGTIVLRVPLAASYGWRTYGGYWVQLDPPRHVHLYSVSGMKALAERVGLETQAVLFDSTSFMVTGSEASLAGMRPHTHDPITSLSTQAAFGWMRSRRIAALTNRTGAADQAAFILTKKK